MANSGLKKVTQLRKYINGRPTDEVKDNSINTEGYIPDVVSEESCPVGCDAVVSGNAIVKGTTTTTTTTTIAVTPDPILGRSYAITNLDTQNQSIVEYTNDLGEKDEEVLQPNEEVVVFSLSVPRRTSGGQVVVEPTTQLTEITTTTTTLAPIQTVDYTIDTSSASESTVILYTPFNSQTVSEAEIPIGKTVNIVSDTEPVIVSGDQSTSITSQGTVTPEEDTYSVTNNDYYDFSVVDFRPIGGLTDETIIAPRETKEIKSQDTPTVTSGSTNVTVTAAGSATQDTDVTIVPKRICNQHELVNESDYIATFIYKDCDLVDREVTLEPREETSVPSVIVPVLTTETATNVGTNFTATEVTKDYGTSGTAITTSTTTTTTSTTTTTTAAPIVSIQDVNCNEVFEINKPEGVVWYPETIKVYVGPKTGDLKFVSFDSGFEGNLYKVYEGSTLLLDRAFITDSFNQRFMRQMYDALIDQGMSTLSATEYTYGNKRVEPEKDFTQTNVRGNNYKTEQTITKTTFEEYITVEVYKPVEKGNWVTFKIECIQ